MHSVLEQLGTIGIIPLIKIDDPDSAVPLAKALIAGGIPCAEITFRTAAGEESLRRIHAEVPEILLGAGTVLNTAQVDKALAAGAQFILSPGFNPRLVDYCIEKGIPVTPGCSTPSDMGAALEAGLEVVKFFPAEQTGGLDYIKALAAPYSKLKFIPAGGINAANIASYTAYGKTLACCGSWIVDAGLINAGRFDTITSLCREAVSNMLGFTLIHIGINTASEAEALCGAKFFETFFGFPPRITDKSVFAGAGIEIMNFNGRGTKGHIAIGTWSIPKALARLRRLGIQFIDDSAAYNASGDIALIYLSDEIMGFAVHLVQR
jgi:2-dehydro-3-deoxyphosphogluconate aldolase/(4S)-4-hydroxy-2-oxoglutarate aldolase